MASRVLIIATVLVAALASATAASAAASHDAAATAGPYLWPTPQKVQLQGGPRSLAADFVIGTSNKNANLLDAITRYTGIIKKAVAAGAGAAAGTTVATTAPDVVNVTVVVTGHNNGLGPATDYRCVLLA